MNEARRRLIQGVILGCFIGAGAVFVAFWHIIASATNAGAMVNGQFQAYSADPSWSILLGGGLLLVAGGVVFLVLTWRGLASSGS